MPRLTDATRQRRRDTIADAAMRLFARDGFASTTMAEIIAEAGTSAGSVYSNFTSKPDLVRYTATRAIAGLMDSFGDDLATNATPASVLEHLLRPSVESSHASTLIQIWAEAPRNDELAAIASDSTSRLGELIMDALQDWTKVRAASLHRRPAALAEEMADLLLSLVQGFIVRAATDVELDRKKFAARLVRTVRATTVD